MSETTPLLHPDDYDVYERFSPLKKRVIVAVISWSAINARFAAGSFVPSVPEIAKDLNTTPMAVNNVVGVYMTTLSIGLLFWGRYSEYYGRQPIYRISFPLLCLGALLSSLCQNITQLAIGRAVQAFGAASILSVGGATIGDIYRLEERGIAIGIYAGTGLLGPALAPLIGGLAATYSSWRMMQWILFGMSLMALVLVFAFIPETKHPGSRGIDAFREQEAKSGRNPQWALVWLNPFRSLSLLRGPNVLLVAFAAMTALMTDYVLLIPMSYTLGPAFKLNSPALIGACFLPSGVGNAVGAAFIGHISDKIITKARKRRNGKWIPEDRLLATLPAAVALTPLSILIYGMTIQFLPGKLIGMIIILFCLFANGLGVMAMVAPVSTYLVDILPGRSAEALAVSSALRNAVAAGTAAAVLPIIRKLGILMTSGIAAIVAWLGFAALYITIVYGSQLRAWKDVGYTVKNG